MRVQMIKLAKQRLSSIGTANPATGWFTLSFVCACNCVFSKIKKNNKRGLRKRRTEDQIEHQSNKRRRREGEGEEEGGGERGEEGKKKKKKMERVGQQVPKRKFMLRFNHLAVGVYLPALLFPPLSLSLS